ncbi:MAG: AMP-binding protein, partial [Actinomycetota bacterium]
MPDEPLKTLPTRLNMADYFLFDRLREGMGDQPAIRTDERVHTYGEVAVAANGYAAGLTRVGTHPEQRVLIARADGAEFVGALFGILQIGAVAVPINPDLRTEHLSAIVEAARPA